MKVILLAVLLLSACSAPVVETQESKQFQKQERERYFRECMELAADVQSIQQTSVVDDCDNIAYWRSR